MFKIKSKLQYEFQVKMLSGVYFNGFSLFVKAIKNLSMCI